MHKFQGLGHGHLAVGGGAGILPTTVTIFCMKTNMDILQNEYKITIFLRKERRLKSISGSQRGHSGLFPQASLRCALTHFHLDV